MVRYPRLLAALLLLAGAPQLAPAQDSVVFDGERYARVHRERQSDGDRMVQFVREPETLENWTRAIAFFRHATLGNDPTAAAYRLRDAVRAANPDAQTRIVVDTVTSDAIVDFLTWPPDGRYLEFNVVRYVKNRAGGGLLAFQFAQRLRGVTKDYAERYSKDRLSFRNQVMEFDMAKIHAALE